MAGKRKKKSVLTLTLDKCYYNPDKLVDEKLKKAAKDVTKEINHHFKYDKWPIHYSHYIEEIYYRAYGVSLENYLLAELFKQKKYVLKTSEKHGRLVIDLQKDLIKRKRTK